MNSTPEWESLRASWPNAHASQFIEVAGLRWHLQRLGSGPAILLLHGSGAASHSWGDVAARLAVDHTVIVPDLPGHGFTSRPPDTRLSLEGMARALLELLAVLDVDPVVIAGHSAGGAIALRMATLPSNIRNALRGVVGVNAALTPPRESMSVFAPLVQSVARSSFIGGLTALLAESDSVFRSLMRSTGSEVTPSQYVLYRTFARSPQHTNALMTMFSSWDMSALLAALPALELPVTLVVGTHDGWVPPEQSRRVAASLRRARVIEIDGAGHLAHEERATVVADIIAEAARAASVTGDSREGAARSE